MNAMLTHSAPAIGRDGAMGSMSMSNNLPVRRLPVRLEGDDRRVILRPFVMSNGRVRTLFERLDAMSEETVGSLLADVTASFADRHAKLSASFDEHYKLGIELTGWKPTWSKPRQALAGAHLTGEITLRLLGAF